MPRSRKPGRALRPGRLRPEPAPLGDLAHANPAVLYDLPFWVKGQAE